MGHLICFFGNHSERRDWDRFHCRPASGALTCTKSTPNLHGCDNKARRSSGESKITFSLLSLIFVWRFITAQYISFGRIRKGFVGALRTYQRAGPTESGSNVHILDGLFIDPPHVHTGRSASSEAAGRPSSRLHEPTHTGWRKPPQAVSPPLVFLLVSICTSQRLWEKHFFNFYWGLCRRPPPPSRREALQVRRLLSRCRGVRLCYTSTSLSARDCRSNTSEKQRQLLNSSAMLLPRGGRACKAWDSHTLTRTLTPLTRTQMFTACLCVHCSDGASWWD